MDNETSRRNVSRMAVKAGYQVEVEERGDGIYLRLSRGGAELSAAPQLAVGRTEPAAGPLVLVVPSDRMGRGSEEHRGH